MFGYFFSSIGTMLSCDPKSIFATSNGKRDCVNARLDEIPTELTGNVHQMKLFYLINSEQIRIV